MLFMNTKTGEYPRYQGDLELLGWQVGKELPKDWVEVEYASEIPQPTNDELVYEIQPVEKDGKYIQTFEKRAMTAEEIERRDAPKRAKEKLIALGLTEAEIQALAFGLVR